MDDEQVQEIITQLAIDPHSVPCYHLIKGMAVDTKEKYNTILKTKYQKNCMMKRARAIRD